MNYDASNYAVGVQDPGFAEETPHLERIFMATVGLFGLPRSFLDIGCGLGQTVQLARRLGIPAKGVEFTPRTDTDIIRADLREPLPSIFPGGADLVFNWEVAEHLPEESADVLAKSLYENLAPGGILVFTAALPNQEGLGHINCQLPWYWMDKFSRFGLKRDQHRTAALAFIYEFACGGYMYHIRQNMNCFLKG